MKDNKKNEIREIALNLFRNHTYDSVSVNRIAKEAGISKNTFYYYFSSKEELIMEVFKPELLFDDAVMIKLSSLTKVEDQIRVIYQSAIQYFVRLGKPIVKVVIQANLNYDFAKNEMPKPSEMPAIAQVLMNIFKRAIDEKVIRTDLKPLELMKLSAIVLTGCLQIWATAPHDIDLEKFYMKKCRTHVKYEMKRTAFVQFFYFRNLLSGKRVCRMTAMIAPKLAWTIWNGSLSIAAFGVA